MVNERVAGYARLFVVGLRESSIDDHQASTSLDGVLTTCHMHRHMAVDDVSVGVVNAECIENLLGYGLVVA